MSEDGGREKTREHGSGFWRFFTTEGIRGIPRASSAHIGSNCLAFLSIFRCHKFSRNPFRARFFLLSHACAEILFLVPSAHDNDSLFSYLLPNI
jgi:hypothetical protein